MVLQYAMFVRSSSATTAAVFLAVISAIEFVVAVTEVTSETVVSVYDKRLSYRRLSARCAMSVDILSTDIQL